MHRCGQPSELTVTSPARLTEQCPVCFINAMPLGEQACEYCRLAPAGLLVRDRDAVAFISRLVQHVLAKQSVQPAAKPVVRPAARTISDNAVNPNNDAYDRSAGEDEIPF